MRAFLNTVGGTPAALLTIVVIVALVAVEVVRVSERVPVASLRRWSRPLVPLAVLLLLVAVSRPLVLG